jgi:hypothetical protein
MASALARRRASGTEDPYCLTIVGVGDNEQRSVRTVPNGQEPMLADGVIHVIKRKRKRIAKYSPGVAKRHAMLRRNSAWPSPDPTKTSLIFLPRSINEVLSIRLTSGGLLNHPIGTQEDRVRDRDADRFRGLQV